MTFRTGESSGVGGAGRGVRVPQQRRGGSVDHPVVVRSVDHGAPDWLRRDEFALALYSVFPVIASGRKLGGLAIAWSREQPPPTVEDLAYARSLARLAEVALFNARILADSATAMEDCAKVAS